MTADVFESIPNNGMVISGAANAYLKNYCEMYKIKLVELFARDDVAIFNSIPTAEGAIMMAIQNTDFTIHGSTKAPNNWPYTAFSVVPNKVGISNVVLSSEKTPQFSSELCTFVQFVPQSLASNP